MIRINVGGLAAKEIRDLAAQIGGADVDVRVTSDMAGAQEVAARSADYYFGACATGAGGALAMAVAILGFSSCCWASTAGRPPKADDIRAAVAAGQRAFGFTTDHLEPAVTMLVQAILAERGLGAGA